MPGRGAPLMALAALLLLAASPALAQNAAVWDSSTYQSGAKEGFGTARERASRVWFTITKGAVSEVFSPLVSNTMLRGIEFAVSDGRSFLDLASRDMEHEVVLVDSRTLEYEVTSRNRERGYILHQRIFTDPARDALIIRVRLESARSDSLRLVAIVDPMGCGTGDDDTGAVIDGTFVLDDSVACVIGTDSGFDSAIVDYVFGSEENELTIERDPLAGPGNIVFFGRVPLSPEGTATVIAAFGPDIASARAVLEASRARGAGAIERDYADGWRAYCTGLVPPRESDDTLYYASAMILASCEDKENPGAFIASPSMGWGDIGGPWGDFRGDHNDQYYFKIWSRDLYQSATALLAAGDSAAARRALGFLDRRVQLPDGSFPQAADVTGRMLWPVIQMDEVACPILLAHRLVTIGAAGRDEHWNSLVRPAADYIMENGPVTRAERWENVGGYSPATIASEVAALFCAADLARMNGETGTFLRYFNTARAWDASIEKWTYTIKANRFDSGGHYVRISLTGAPDENDFNRDDIDVSFLELVRLGLRRADDPLIRNSMRACDRYLERALPTGSAWRRFTEDDYGEGRHGMAWPLLAGERGHAEVAAGISARPRIEAMRRMAPGVTLSEQVFDQGRDAGRPTGSCAPLAWAHAEYLKLVLSDSFGRIVDMPEPMRARLAASDPKPIHIFPFAAEAAGSMNAFVVLTDRSAEELGFLRATIDGAAAACSFADGRLTIDPAVTSSASTVAISDSGGRVLYEGRPLSAQAERRSRRTIRRAGLAGSFNAWNPSDFAMMMTEVSDGVFTKTLRLAAGSYEYKYTINGSWEINFGGVGEEIRQDGPNYRLDVSEEADYVFTLRTGDGGWQRVERVTPARP